MPKTAPQPFDLVATPPCVLMSTAFPCLPGQRVGPFWSESSLFLVAVRGKGTIQIGSTIYELTPGWVIHIPWCCHAHLAADRADPLALIGVHMSYQPWSQAVPELRQYSVASGRTRTIHRMPPYPQLYEEPLLVNVPPDSRLLDIATDITHACEIGTTDTLASVRHTRLRGLALTFIAEFQACLQTRARHGQSLASAAQTRLVHEIASFMELTLSHTQATRRGQLAARAKVSETTLADAFRAVTGKGPIDYLIDLRITRARRALRTSRKQIRQIAAEVGIPNVYYFSKLFKKRVGCSPLQYRSRLKI
jgi:AraC-like DNA-binding protein